MHFLYVQLSGCLLDALNPEEIHENESQVISSSETKYFSHGDISVTNSTKDNGYIPAK